MAIKISTITIFIAVISLFLAVIFFFLLYLYAQYYWSPRSNRRRAIFIFAAGDPQVPSRGLESAALRSLPITLFKPSDFKDGFECAVCLSELTAGEETRLLPKCNHGFHLECIDMWFHSHSTCPICRCPVGPEAAEDELPASNVLLWGDQNQGSTRRSDLQEGNSGSSDSMLVISIPTRATEGLFQSSVSPLPSSRSQVEEMKSPVEEEKSSATSKLTSFKRLLSRGKRTGGSSCSSPRIGDIEQGLVGSGAANGEGSWTKTRISSL